METLTYRILRYVPDLLRDEWINVGVVLCDAARGELRSRVIAEAAELARLRRLHPEADESLLAGLASGLDSLLAAGSGDVTEWFSKMEASLSNVLQLGPQKAVRTDEPQAELDRIYEAQVRPPERRTPGLLERADSKAGLRIRLREVFHRAGLWSRLEKSAPVAEFTFAGDPFRMDYAYRKNGTRGFIHALPLTRDPAQAKAFCLTAGSIRERVPGCVFHAVTEPAPENDGARYRALAGFLRDDGIEVLPAPQVYEFAQRLRATLQ